MKIILFVNSAKTYFWHRKPLADHLINAGHDVVVVCSNDGDIAKFSKERIKLILIDMSRKGTNPVIELILLTKLIKIFKQEKPDICHNFTIKCVIYGSIAQRFAGVLRIVNTITGLGHSFIKGGLIQIVAELMYKVALNFSNSKVIFQNTEDLNLFINRRIVKPSKSFLVSGSGVDINFFYPRSQNFNTINILFAGRLLKSKGLIELLKASIELYGKGLNHCLLLAGELDEMNPDTLTNQELDTYKTFSHIKFLGNVEDLRPVYESSQIACLPSYREGLSKFLIESAAAGLAIVTSDAPGCREVVKDNGLLVKVGSVEDLVSKLESLIVNPKLIQAYGHASRILAVEKFSQEMIISEILSLYE